MLFVHVGLKYVIYKIFLKLYHYLFKFIRNNDYMSS